jgi:hypothetical protein
MSIARIATLIDPKVTDHLSNCSILMVCSLSLKDKFSK